MVPYVRKSFYKHFKEGLYWFGNDKYLEDITNETSIEDEKYKLNQNAYEYALRQTQREIHQAVEALYHNLNY